MIRRFFNIIFVALALFFLDGCTLMMEDLTQEEERVDLEEVGFEEPYTEETEYGNITFQYGDSTRVMRKRAMDYLVAVEGDSVLYFSDNIPKDLLVPVGQYVSMGCNELLRHGLCSKVIELTQANGMYRMVTTRVSQAKVYKQFDVDININYDQQMSFDPEEYLEEQDATLMENDTVTVFTDWAFFGKEVVDRKETQIRKRIQAKRALTRADDDDDDEQGETGNSSYSPKDEDTDVLKSKERSVRLFTLNAKKLGKFPYPFPNLIDKGLQISFVCHYHEQTTLRHIQKISDGQDYVKDIYDETATLKTKAKIGWSKKMADPSEKLQKVWNKAFDGFNKSDFAKKHDISSKNFMIHIPIPVTAGAVEIFLRIAPKVNVEFGLMGEFEETDVLGGIHKEVEYINGKQGTNSFVYDPKKFSTHIDKFDLYGFLKFNAGIEILAGAAVAKGAFGLGAGIELGFNATFQATALTIGTGGNPKGTYLSEEIYLKPKIKAFAQSPAGKEWGSIEWKFPFCKEKYTPWGPHTQYFYPSIGKADGEFKIKSDNGRTVADISANFKFSDLNLYGLLGDIYDPGATVQRVTNNGSKETVKDIYTEIFDKKISTDVTYSLSYTDDDYVTGCYYKVMPVLCDKLVGESNHIDYSENRITCTQTSQSTLTYLDLFQQGYAIKEDNGEDFEDWSFVVQSHISNLSKMSEWKEWGVKLSLDEWNEKKAKWEPSLDENNKDFKNKKFPIKKNITKNTVSVKFSIYGYSGTQYRVTAHLYYIDKGGHETTFTHPNRFTDEEEDDFFGDPLAKGMLILTPDMDQWGNGAIGSKDQVINMGDI